MERKSLLTVAIDAETAAILRRVADQDCEGNKSQAARRLIKFGDKVWLAGKAAVNPNAPTPAHATEVQR